MAYASFVFRLGCQGFHLMFVLCAQGFDLVIHTAGPFQWKLTSSVLEAAIAAKVPYIDVADDADFSAVRA